MRVVKKESQVEGLIIAKFSFTVMNGNYLPVIILYIYGTIFHQLSLSLLSHHTLNYINKKKGGAHEIDRSQIATGFRQVLCRF